jgi:hypothetical protein
MPIKHPHDLVDLEMEKHKLIVYIEFREYSY